MKKLILLTLLILMIAGNVFAECNFHEMYEDQMFKSGYMDIVAEKCIFDLESNNTSPWCDLYFSYSSQQIASMKKFAACTETNEAEYRKWHETGNMHELNVTTQKNNITFDKIWAAIIQRMANQ